MRVAMLAGMAVVVLSGCSMGNIQHYSTYDLNRDGVLDARCSGTEYDVDNDRWYSWRSDASDDCGDDQPLDIENEHLIGTNNEAEVVYHNGAG